MSTAGRKKHEHRVYVQLNEDPKMHRKNLVISFSRSLDFADELKCALLAAVSLNEN